MLTVLVLVLVVVGGVAAWATLTDDSATAATSAQPSERAVRPITPVNLLSIASASATCVSPPGHDAAGTTVTYSPARVADGSPQTAWRCDGDGTGQRLEVDFAREVTLVGVGLIPGYAKTDPLDGADRYLQNRRISAVQYEFDDGTTAMQTFDTDPFFRAPQTISLPSVSTSTVTITILGSVSGQPTGDQDALDKVAISELVFSSR